MNNPYLDSTFIYQSMTKSATFKAQPTPSKSRNRLRPFINRLRSGSKNEPPEVLEGAKIKFKLDEQKTQSASPLTKGKKKAGKKANKKQTGKAKAEENGRGTSKTKDKAKQRGKKEEESDGADESNSEESDRDSESESDENRGHYPKGMLKIRKQRSISMNSLLQDFFHKIDQQAREPALSLVTPSPSRSPTIESLHESGDGTDSLLMLTPSQRAMTRARDAVMLTEQGVPLPSSEDSYLSNEEDERSSAKYSSSSGSFPAVPKVLSANFRRLSTDCDTATSFGSERSEDDIKAIYARKAILKDEKASGHYVGTGVEDVDSSDDTSEWSDDDKAPTKAKELTPTSGSSEIEVQETNAYGGFFAGSETSDTDTDTESNDNDSSDELNKSTLSTGGNLEELLHTFSKQYIRILEDGKQLEKSDDADDLKTVLQLRTLQQLQDLSLELIKTTQANLNPESESPEPLRMTRSDSNLSKSSPQVKKEKKRRRLTTGYGKCVDWNGTFQDILWVNEGDDRSLIDRYHALKDLAHDFNHAARTYATIIIEEAFLPHNKKTIPPIRSLGGQAGGEKYVHAGILFKFATDAAGIYGGDEYAMKAAGHELKGLINFYKVHHFGICVPLMTIIDYRGFRLVAQALLPIGDETLVYGSSDAGTTVRNDSREIERALASACNELNLAKHLVYPKRGAPVQMFGPGDMEGHCGLDGRYYLIDFARVFPPETPESGTKGAFLYKLLRPELVARNSVPLSSDSFSRFGGPTMEQREPHDLHTKQATDILVDELVPRFANWLDRQYERVFPAREANPSASSFSEFLLPGSTTGSNSDEFGSNNYDDSFDISGTFTTVQETDRMPEIGDMDDWASPIIQEMHRMGINVRYLGLARSRCTNEAARAVLLSEMLCRVVKNLLRERLRERMRALRTMAEEPYKEVILELFNLLLGETYEAAKKWWTQDIKMELSKRFRHALAAEELEPDYDLKQSLTVPYPALFIRLQLLTAVRLTPEAISDLKNGELTTLVSADIRGQGVSGKDMNIVSTAEAIALAIRCLDGATSAREADRLLRLAIRKFEKAIGRMPGDMELINYYANFLYRKVSMFVNQVIAQPMGCSTNRPATRSGHSRRKSRGIGDDFANWAEEKWDNDDDPAENSNMEEKSTGSSVEAAENANGPMVRKMSAEAVNASKLRASLYLSGGTSIGGVTSSSDDDSAAGAAAWTKLVRSIRWHMALLSKMLKLFKTCENFVMLNFLADLCKQFAAHLKQIDVEIKRAHKAQIKLQKQRLATGSNNKKGAHVALSLSAPGGSPSYILHHGSGVAGASPQKANPAILPGLGTPRASSSGPSLHYVMRSNRAVFNEGMQERDRDRRRELLYSFQLQALYLTNECYMAISVLDETTPFGLDLSHSLSVDANELDRRPRSPRKTTSVPSLRHMAPPTSIALTASSTLPTLIPRNQSDQFSPSSSSSSGETDSTLTLKEKRSSMGMHIFPHRSASFIGKKMMPFVYFRWAELQYLRARILEKKTALERRLHEHDLDESDEEEMWDSQKAEVLALRAVAGQRYRTAFQLLESTDSRNIVQRANADEPKLDDSGTTRASGERKDARRWVMSAYPTNEPKQNINLASVMELYRCNLEKHGRWAGLAADSLGGLYNSGSSTTTQAHKAQEQQLEKDEEQKSDEEPESGGSKGKKKGNKKEKKAKEKEKKAKRLKKSKQESLERKSSKESATEESPRSRGKRDKEELQKAQLMQDMKKAKDTAKNKNKIMRPEDEEEEDGADGEGRKLRIVESDDILNESEYLKSEGSAKKGKTSSGSSAQSGSDNGRRATRPRDRNKPPPSISAQLRTQKLKTFDDEWLPEACVSDELFLTVLKNAPVQEVILGARRRFVPMSESPSDRKTKRPTRSTLSCETLAYDRRGDGGLQFSGKRRSVQIGAEENGSSSAPSPTRRTVLLSPFTSSTSATLPPTGSFASGRSHSAVHHSPSPRGTSNANSPSAVSVDALQKAAANGCLNELTHLTLKRYEDLTDAQFESIIRIQLTSLTSLRLEGCTQISDKTLQHLSTSLFGPHLKHLSFANCPRLTNRGVLDLVKTATNLVSLSLDGCEKISNKPIIYMAKGSPNLRHLSLLGCKKISDKSIVEIATHATNLASLRVSSDRVTDDSLRLMARNLPQLYSLTLVNCDVSIEGVVDVCSGVAAQQLTHLYFIDCNLGSRDQVLSAISTKCRNLSYLYVKQAIPLTSSKK